MNEQSIVFDALDGLEIPYEHLRHAPCHTMEDCAKVAGPLNALYPKNVFLCNRQKTSFFLVVMHPDKRFVTKDVSKQIESARLSFAPDEQLHSMLHLRPGAITPLTLVFESAKDVQLVIDEDLREYETLCFHPLVNDESIVLGGGDFFERFLPFTGHGYKLVHMDFDEDKA